MKGTAWLKEQEWSMGNGQCPACYECRPGSRWGEYISSFGHKRTCPLAGLLAESGEAVLWSRKRKASEYMKQSPETAAAWARIQKRHDEFILSLLKEPK